MRGLPCARFHAEGEALSELKDRIAGQEASEAMLGTLAHELRTPLATIAAAASTLGREDVELGEDQRRALLRVISGEAARLTRMVSGMLAANRLATAPPAARPCDALALARESVEAARVIAPQKVTIDLDGGADLPSVAADPDSVRQVLANLLENALKYAPEGRTVRLAVGSDGPLVRFSVADEGPGIPEAEQDRVFEKFFRLDPHGNPGVDGTGLGLYICRELVRRMGGRIWVESAPGHGSRFTFELPTT